MFRFEFVQDSTPLLVRYNMFRIIISLQLVQRWTTLLVHYKIEHWKVTLWYTKDANTFSSQCHVHEVFDLISWAWVSPSVVPRCGCKLLLEAKLCRLARLDVLDVDVNVLRACFNKMQSYETSWFKVFVIRVQNVYSCFRNCWTCWCSCFKVIQKSCISYSTMRNQYTFAQTISCV